MAKSESVREMGDLQKKLSPIFKKRNFRRRERTYNRPTADGIIHVVNFQMGRFDPPGTVVIPRLRENYYRKFTINVGVYVPEVAQYEFDSKAREFVPESSCCVRARLGDLGPEAADIWWDIQSGDELVDELKQRLEVCAFPFLSRFETRDALLQTLLNATDSATFSSPRSRVDCAIILASRGLKTEARELLVAHRAAHIRKHGHPSHLKYLEDLAVKLDWGVWRLASTS